MKEELQFKGLSKSDLCSLAEKFGNQIKIGDSIFLNGPVGAGKTFFISCLIRKKLIDAGFEDFVTSPTFNLVQIYDELDDPIWHIDLYRIEKPKELIEIGLEQALHEAICLIEWPDILGETIADKAAVISIGVSPSDLNKRDLSVIIPEINFNNEKFYSSL